MNNDAIAREIVALKKRLAKVERSSRLSHAALDDTALEVRDADGSLRALVGQQSDGTTAANFVNGPTPPTPTAPTVTPALAALEVAWDGGFADDIAAPLDWMRVEVHVGTTAGFTPDQTTLRDTIETPQGGTVTVTLPYSERFVKLRSRTTAGVAGPATDAVSGTPRQAEAPDIVAGSITADLLAADAIDGKTITGAIVRTAASGDRIVLDSTTNTITVYDASDNVLAQVVPDGSFGGGGGFWSRGFHAPDNIYSLLAGGQLAFNTTDDDADTSGRVEWTYIGAQNDALLTLKSGSATSSQSPAWLQLLSESNTRTRPRAYFGDNGSGPCDVDISGILSAGNIAFGSINITPSAANTPTSALVSGFNLQGTTVRAFVTANSTVPGTSMLGVSVSSVTTTSLTAWLTRSNTATTTVYWTAFAS